MQAIATPLVHGGETLLLDPLGVLFWPATAMLVVADLHLEKGSAFARRGTLLPPYDTARTLRRLGWAIERYGPRVVVSLGDAFHDRAGPAALTSGARDALADMAKGREWLWVHGNHDPGPLAPGLEGEAVDQLDWHGLRFAHLPEGERNGRALVAGHLHPKAQLERRGRKVSRPCFAGDASCLVLPAFGAYTGGLNVLDPAISGLFEENFCAFLLGDAKVYRVAHHHLQATPPDWRRHRLEDR